MYRLFHGKVLRFMSSIKSAGQVIKEDMWLAFFFFGVCSQSILDFRFVPLFLKQNKEQYNL
jgi:hypothetical protein